MSRYLSTSSKRQEWKGFILGKAPTYNHCHAIAAAVDVNPATVNSWRHGRAVAVAKLFTRLAHIWGLTEKDLFHAINLPFQSVDEYYIYHKQQKKNRENQKAREKYAANPKDPKILTARLKYCQRLKEARIARAIPGTLAYVRRLDPEIRRSLKLERRRESRSKNGWSLHRIKREIRIIGKGVERCEKIWENHTRPWRTAGYSSKRAYEMSTKAGRNDLRIKRQTWSANKRAKRKARQDIYDANPISPKEWYGLMRDYGYKCAYCGRHRRQMRTRQTGVDLEMDHVVPMDHPGFSHSLANLAPACKPCNSSKGDSDLLEWAQRKGVTLDWRVLAQYNTITHMVIHKSCAYKHLGPP